MDRPCRAVGNATVEMFGAMIINLSAIPSALESSPRVTSAAEQYAQPSYETSESTSRPGECDRNSSNGGGYRLPDRRRRLAEARAGLTASINRIIGVTGTVRTV